MMIPINGSAIRKTPYWRQGTGGLKACRNWRNPGQVPNLRIHIVIEFG
jgi:hypothetical protein